MRRKGITDNHVHCNVVYLKGGKDNQAINSRHEHKMIKRNV